MAKKLVLVTEPVFIPCVPKQLPEEIQVAAATTAISINPTNAPASALLSMMMALSPPEDTAQEVHPALARAVMTSRYWGSGGVRLTVSFMESVQSSLRDRILSHMNAWHNIANGNVSFTWTQSSGDVRITLAGEGYWSYMGTDIKHISANQPTMCLQAFTMSTPESEFIRVVRHETGHTIGLPHEHMRKELVARIDPLKAYRYFQQTQGWNRQTVDEQVLTPLDESDFVASTAPDQMSIMCYQLPGSITKDGKPITGGNDIDASDCALISRVYPLVVQPQPPPPPPSGKSSTILVNWDTRTITVDGKQS